MNAPRKVRRPNGPRISGSGLGTDTALTLNQLTRQEPCLLTLVGALRDGTPNEELFTWVTWTITKLVNDKAALARALAQARDQQAKEML